jgi:hypothetical protein
MKTYFTITGTKHYYGQDFFEKGMKVRLEKEPDNKVDREAIKVTMEGLGLVGYVANSTFTVLGEIHSAGRLYDKIVDTASGTIRYVLDKGVLCELEEE